MGAEKMPTDSGYGEDDIQVIQWMLRPNLDCIFCSGQLRSSV